MRIITIKRLEAFWLSANTRDSKTALLEWIEDVEEAAWVIPTDVKDTFGKRIDFVKSRKTGRPLAVFDIGGNKYRLIAAIHFVRNYPHKGRVYVLRIMTHKQYDDGRWKYDF